MKDEYITAGSVRNCMYHYSSTMYHYIGCRAMKTDKQCMTINHKSTHMYTLNTEFQQLLPHYGPLLILQKPPMHFVAIFTITQCN